ncbi:MAG: hypothetical protein CVU92_02750 [Firmicutes bacterium HGW-Firmicutes-17]|nr:MAG: hypothetical protein CVU92_02750 [Firmicutes bacterium HGW-Firmicutes-17]
MISVRQTRVLPLTSFRFHLTMDTLVLSYALGTINLRSGLSPVRLRPCRAHTSKTASNFTMLAVLQIKLLVFFHLKQFAILR